MVSSEIIEKVKKLFALAADNPNQNESLAAMKKARELMRENGIQDVDLATGEVNGVKVEAWDSGYLGQIDTYSQILAMAAADLFSCEKFMVRPGKIVNYKVKMCFIGDKVDLALVTAVWPYLVKTAKNLAASEFGKGWTSSHRSFCEAFATRIYERVKEMNKEEEEEDTSNMSPLRARESQSYALVVQKKQDEIQLWMDEHDIKLKHKNRRFKGRQDRDAIYAGREAGNKVNLNFRGQLGGGDQPKMIS